ncbi:DedA family protein [Thermodesulfobacteriota bacterium]
MDSILHYLDNLPDFMLYIFLGFGTFMENIFPPAPGDMVVVLGAFLIGTGRLNFIMVFISTTAGSFLGFMTLFWLGRYLGRRFFIERDYFFFKKDHIIRTGNWFKKYGYFIITLNRFFPGVRSVISIAGGMYKLETIKVAYLALISCSLWNIVWMSIGYTLGNNWGVVEKKLTYIFARYNMIVFSMFLVLFVYVILRKNKND